MLRFTIIPRAVAATALCLALAGPAWTQEGSGPSIRAMDDYFSRLVEANRLPGLSVAVVRDGEALFIRAYGSDGLGGAMSPDTRLCVGSVSKSFTALAILQLARRGLVDLDAPFSRYVPWFDIDGTGADAITVRHLLTHTSGLDERGDPAPEIPGATSRDEVISLARVRPSAAPGLRFSYYNKNYRALGYLVEVASGLSYGRYLSEHVFGPLGMAGASTDPAGIARGTAPFFGLAVPVPNTYYPGDAPAGGLVMSAADAAKYLIALMPSSPRGEEPVVGAGFADDLRSFPEGVGSQYGLGWRVERGGSRLTHGGDVSGFHAYAEINLDTRVGCMVLCRQNGLVPMLGVFDQLPVDMHRLLEGKDVPDPGAYAWISPATLALALAACAYQAWRFASLSRWLGKAERRGPAMRVAMTALPAIAAASLLFLPAIVTALLGLACAWPDLFHFLPDLALIALLTSIAGLARTALRLRLLLARRR